MAGAMLLATPLSTLRRGLVVFWALWTTIVLATNVTDVLKVGGVLPAWWAFASGNYALVAKVAAIYRLPSAAVAFLFAGLVAWQALAMALLWRAAAALAPGGRGREAVDRAFTVSLALWAAFIIADEVFIAYHTVDLGGVHMGIVTAQLVSLLAIRLLPDDAGR